MLNYRLHSNLRLKKAKARIRPFVTKTSRVLDIGCGIGIVTECIAKQATQGRVWGVDLSPENIWYAMRTIRLRNLSFLDSDVVTSFDKIERVLDGPVDLITMIDVIEHIPEEGRGAVLHNLRRVAKNDALLILTYPSPQHQQYLREKDPKELQIIDNIISIETLLVEARAAGFFLRHYSLETVWQKNQYVHCIFGDRSLLSGNSATIRNNKNAKRRATSDRIFSTSSIQTPQIRIPNIPGTLMEHILSS